MATSLVLSTEMTPQEHQQLTAHPRQGNVHERFLPVPKIHEKVLIWPEVYFNQLAAGKMDSGM